MTVVAGRVQDDGSVVLAADTGLTKLQHRSAGANKLVRLGDAVVGWTGVSAVSSAIRICRPYRDPDDVESWLHELAHRVWAWSREREQLCDDGDGSRFAPATLLVATPGALWEIDGIGGVVLVAEGYSAVGAGAAIAIGALYTGVTVRVAVEACLTHAHGCFGQVIQERLLP